jgi:hypothetical protein
MWKMSVTLDGYEMENVEAVDISTARFMPGDRVKLDDGDEFYPGANGYVVGVGQGYGPFFGGQRVYDVAIDDDDYGLYFDPESADDIARLNDEDDEEASPQRVVESRLTLADDAED